MSIEDQDMTGLEDQDLARLRANKLGYILQSADFVPNQNLLANVAVPLLGTGMHREEIPRVARDALRLVGMESCTVCAIRLSSSPPKNVRWLPWPGQWLTTRR